ncbi:MAG: hypothetical protein KU29_13600 [Sulfurovum sp. FS06-10]|jgi:hypothetical protein|nr:MAG: hypothetical protein KU29_13600 [Sulfurovum sp. FS06-10]
MQKRVLTLNLLVTLLLLTACGYKPSSHYTPQVLGKNIATEVDVSMSDPENAVLIKDALHKAIYTRLGAKVNRKGTEESLIRIIYHHIGFMPLQYDQNGYVVYYQAVITLRFEFTKGKIQENRLIVGRYQFPIRPSAIISNDLRFKAIEQGSIKALDQFIAYISAKGLLEDEK